MSGVSRYQTPRRQGSAAAPIPPGPPQKRRRGRRAAWVAAAAFVLLALACMLLYQPQPLTLLPNRIQPQTGDTGALQWSIDGAYTRPPELCGLFILSPSLPVSVRLLEPMQNADATWGFTAEPAAQEGTAVIPFALYGHTLLLGDALPISQPLPVLPETAAPSQPPATLPPSPTAAPTAAPTPIPTAAFTAAPIAKPTPTATPTPTAVPTATPTPSPTATATPVPAKTAVPTFTPDDGQAPAASAFRVCPPGTRYYYHQLSAAQKEIFALLYNGIAAFASDIAFDTPCAQADLERAMYVILYDCPELFQLEGHYQYAVDTKDSVHSLTPTYQMTETEYQTRLAQTLAVIDALPGLPADKSDAYAVELAVFRALKALSTYDDQRPFCGSAFSPLLNGYAKCDGYAQALLLALRRYDIACAMVSGDATDRNDNNTTAPHSWNYVLIDGEWYHCDLTWDDLNMDDANADFHGYLPYFNITDEAMLKTRTIYPQDRAWNLPQCTATAANYLVRKGCVIAADEELQSAVYALLTRAYRQGETEFPVSFQSEAMYLRLKADMSDLLRKWEDQGAKLQSWRYLYDDNIGFIYFYDVVTR